MYQYYSKLASLMRVLFGYFCTNSQDKKYKQCRALMYSIFPHDSTSNTKNILSNSLGVEIKSFLCIFRKSMEITLHISPEMSYNFLQKLFLEHPSTEIRSYFYIYSNDSIPFQLKSQYRRLKLLQLWLQFDRDYSGDLSINEVNKIMVALNFSEVLRSKIIKKLRKKHTKVKFSTFEHLFRDIFTWDELEDVWILAMGSNKLSYMDADLFNEFKSNIQNQDRNYTLKNSLIYELNDNLYCFPYLAYESLNLTINGNALKRNENKLVRGITRGQFYNYLTDIDLNSIIDPVKSGMVYQDMCYPMTFYFINSSHNTYLTGDQFSSLSDTQMYAKVLMSGCRCVELDCWDGPNGEPIIYHGYTRTSRISFRSVIETISNYAFINSVYPVILSLEVHTSNKQQACMADIIKSTLKDKLFVITSELANDSTFKFSPDELKYKVLLKGKRNKSTSFYNKIEHSHPEWMTTSDLGHQSRHDFFDLSGKNSIEDEDSVAFMGYIPDDTPVSECKISPKLSDLISIEARHFSLLNENEPLKATNICSSLTESKSEAISKHNSNDYIKRNMSMFTRVYPSMTRITSSNFHPMPHWAAGCQLVALNWQTTQSYELRYNKGFFLNNGNSGYVLKPEYMRKDASTLNEPLQSIINKEYSVNYKRLRIKIISGFALPKPNNNLYGEIVDPFVVGWIETPSGKRYKQQTQSIQDNGYHPVFSNNSTSIFEFEITDMALTTLVLQVWDENFQFHNFLCDSIIPCSLIRTGYRAVPLQSSSDNEQCNSLLMVHVCMD